MKKPDVRRLLETNPVDICFITLDECSRCTVEKALPDITSFFQRDFPEFNWEFERVHVPENPAEPVNTLTLLDKAYLMMLDKKWDFCFVVLEKKLEARESRSGLLKLSPAHAAGVISLEPLEPLTREGQLAESAFVGLFIEGLLRLNGLRKGAFELVLSEGKDRKLTQDERDHMSNRLGEVATVLPQERMREASRLFVYLWVMLRHPLRITRTVGSNHPWAMVYRSTKIIFAALATVLLSIVTMEFWDLALGQRPYRTILLGVGVIVLTSFYVMWKHHLLVHRRRGQFNEQVAIFNLATIFTVVIGFTLLYVTIFSVDLLLTLILFPRSVLNKWLLLENVGFFNYLRASLLVSNVALLVGALGAGLEDSATIRYLIYGGQEE